MEDGLAHMGTAVVVAEKAGGEIAVSQFPVYDEPCFFLVRLTVSRFSTCSSVCEDSRIFM